jgi:hypothetical protein
VAVRLKPQTIELKEVKDRQITVLFFCQSDDFAELASNWLNDGFYTPAS